MLIWVVALHCEAKPVIDLYRLKKSSQHSAFDLYENDTMQCVVSGIGKTQAAEATAWVAALHHQQVSLCWINLGIAGAAEYVLGEIFRLSEITDQQSNQHFHPALACTGKLKSTSCISLDQPSNDYHPEAIYDMEASAFFATATHFSNPQLVQSLKIISDNRQQQTGYDKTAVSNLIHNQMDAIDHFAQNLLRLKQQLIDDE